MKATLFLFLALFLAVACSDAPTAVDDAGTLAPAAKGGNKGGGGGSSAIPADVFVITDVPGAQLRGESPETAYPGVIDGGNLWIHAPCPNELILDVTAAGLGAPFGASVGTCGDFPPRLTIEAGLLDLDEVGESNTLGSSVFPPNTNMGPATNHYFSWDVTTYNLVWQAGVTATLTSKVEVAGSDPPAFDYTYSITTTAAQAEAADLMRRTTKGKPATEYVEGGDHVPTYRDLVVKIRR
ncbi:MAG TPA: hypothetical protein VM778_15235 [Gemmatimonadota bacterium]|nr:hypothetical protein [Gemmatimonadota bacterium]